MTIIREKWFTNFTRLPFPVFLYFSVDSYDETENVRSYGADSMLGSIGGYIGMIMGLSIFHLPDIFYDFKKWWQHFYDKHSHQRQTVLLSRSTHQTEPTKTTKLQVKTLLHTHGTDTIIETN